MEQKKVISAYNELANDFDQLHSDLLEHIRIQLPEIKAIESLGDLSNRLKYAEMDETLKSDIISCFINLMTEDSRRSRNLKKIVLSFNEKREKEQKRIGEILN
ncbi:hypothetical protein MKO06_02690 [Gramella sp. GC03-9]|uniref:Uncharacterized protein n=1 Tax=Christiangramia oceanisediminis TaxID=2920386 RepID=A0A9X2KXA1_9FLAO|nr:hypothetical protein [Gramella oceanisediminis]MCP9198796.1 hypothetical protein [Gramella oceanisediminis]